MREAQSKLEGEQLSKDEAQTQALKGGKKAMTKIGTRTRETPRTSAWPMPRRTCASLSARLTEAEPECKDKPG